MTTNADTVRDNRSAIIPKGIEIKLRTSDWILDNRRKNKY
jgi:hypothetical protein